MFVICESVAAITLHIREVSPEHPINYGGVFGLVKPKSLCNSDMAWDCKTLLSAARCMTCMLHAIKTGSRFFKKHPNEVAIYTETLKRLGKI